MRKTLLASGFALLALALVTSPGAAADPPRTLDGSGNNVLHPAWGQAGTPYLRLAPANYADGVQSMVGGPPPRYVSNRVFNDVSQNIFSENRISQWGWLWGQFMDHTFGLRDETPGEKATIPFDPSDPLETFTNDFGAIGFSRTPAAPGTGVSGPRQQINTVSSYIDAWNVYGGTTTRLEWLRKGVLDGSLANNKAGMMLPSNYLPRADARGDAATAPPMDLMGALVGTPAKAVEAGDVRANENIALTGVHTLFAREHNRIVAALPDTLSEEDKFQIARRIVGAEEQYVTFTQFLPTLGVQLPAYGGYNANVNASLSNEFATVGYRAHSQIHGEMEPIAPATRYTQAQLDAFTAEGIVVEPDGSTVKLVIPLNLAYGNPDLLEAVGIGPLLKGLAKELEYRNDEQIDDSLRSVLFQVPKPGILDPSVCGEPVVNPDCYSGVVDLGAIDVQRGRDHGMPYYNQLRVAFGLPAKTSFRDLTGDSTASFPTTDPLVDTTNPIDDPNILDFTQLRDADGNVVQPGTDAAAEGVFSATRRTTLAARLKAIYGDVNKVDAFVGMVSEPHVAGTEFGELQLAIWKRQFTALRDGDRFFYANDPQLATIKQQYGIDYRHTLGEIIELNTGVNVPANVFKVALPAPVTDTTAPTVSVTAPAAGTTVSGTSTVSATAADDVGVAGVQFTLDGASLGVEDTSAPYSVAWDTTAAPNGSHTLGAIARDAAGNKTSAAAVIVTVANARPGLVAAYGFDEGSGSSVVDASGKGNGGTVANTTWLAAGKFGHALSFDGASSFVTVPDSPSLDLATGMTLEAWVDPTALGTSWRTVLFKEQPAGMEYSLYANDAAGHPIGQVQIGGEQNARGTGSVPLGAWTHLAVAYDGATLSLYVNGALAAAKPQTGTIDVSSGALKIGGNSIWSEWFQGAIDEVRVYNRALSQTEIQGDMTQPIAAAGPPLPTVLLGDQQVEPAADANTAGVAEASPSTASASGTVRQLSVYLDATSSATPLAAGLYTDNGGHPGTLLAQGTLGAPVPGTWNTVSIPGAGVSAGTTYWVAVLATTGTLVFRDHCCGAVGTGSTETNGIRTLTALPAAWTTGTVYPDGPVSAYGSG